MKKKKIATIAWTDIVTVLLPYKKTAHKTFKLPLNYDSTTDWTNNTKRHLADTEIFIWDEAE